MIFDAFHKQPKKLIGIDIGSKNIKVVEIKRQKGQSLELLNYGIATLSDASARVINNQELSGIIKRLLKDSNIETKDAAFSLPAYATFLTLVDLPKMTDEELNEAVSFEAKKYIPIPLDQVTLGWSRSEDKILLIAVPKDLSRRYAQLAIMAGLDLKVLEAETFSLARALAREEKELVVLIDVGSLSINASLIRQGNIIFNRTINKDAFLLSTMSKVFNKEKIAKVILTGGEIKPELTQELRTILGVNVQIALGNPWQGVKYPLGLKGRLAELAPILGVAVGLAIRSFENG